MLRWAPAVRAHLPQVNSARSSGPALPRERLATRLARGVLPLGRQATCAFWIGTQPRRRNPVDRVTSPLGMVGACAQLKPCDLWLNMVATWRQ